MSSSDLFASDDDFDDDAFGLCDVKGEDDLTDIPADIFGAPSIKLEPASSPSASLHSASNADCTDAASEHESSSNASASPSPSPSPSLAFEPSDQSREAKAARRIARKNRARLHRYHRSKAELVELRAEALQLQKLLEKVKKQDRAEQEQDVEMLLASSPSPFANDEGDEVDPREHAVPKLIRTAATGTSASSWKDVAMVELRQHRRAKAVQRKLERIISEYGQRCGLFQRSWAGTEGMEPTLRAARMTLCPTPRVPGIDSVAAFTHNGAVFLRELYYMACGACGVRPVLSASTAQGHSGGSLAYSLFLGPDVEFGWENEFVLPGGDPQQLLSLYLRALSTQPPSQQIVKASHKTHAFEHTLFEREVTIRMPRGRSLLELHGVKLMQIYEANDHVIIVTSRAINVAGNGSTPLFRSSGWMVVTRSTDTQGASSCLVRSRTRVHCATPGMLTQLDDTTPRRAFLDWWADTMQAKHQAMHSRLRLVMA